MDAGTPTEQFQDLGLFLGWGIAFYMNCMLNILHKVGWRTCENRAPIYSVVVMLASLSLVWRSIFLLGGLTQPVARMIRFLASRSSKLARFLSWSSQPLIMNVIGCLTVGFLIHDIYSVYWRFKLIRPDDLSYRTSYLSCLLGFQGTRWSIGSSSVHNHEKLFPSFEYAVQNGSQQLVLCQMSCGF